MTSTAKHACAFLAATAMLLLGGCLLPNGSADLGSAAQGPSLHEVSILGSHNSYKRRIPPALMDFIADENPDRARSIDYYHHSLTSQLDSGLRQLEIDVLADEQGGLFANPVGARVLESLGRGPGERDGFHREHLQKPGLKVLHIPDIDFLTHCVLFVDCLQQVKAWSDENPDHVPLFILINAKEKGAGLVDGVTPAKFSARSFDRLDETINRVFAPHRLITPDDVRGTSSSLRQAVIDGRWPALSDARGQVVFIFDGNLQQANIYRQGHASLAGRAMFAAVPEDDPEAAILVINDPVTDRQRIGELVSEGFIVRTRSDAGYQTIEQMRRQYDAAVSSGAQIISSDYYPGSPNAERRGYAIPWVGQ